MSQISLRVEFDNLTAEYRPGDQITGRLHTQRSEAWDVRELSIALVWRTEGIGTEDTGTALIEHLQQPGRRVSPTAEFPFQFTAPPMPWTYHGTLVKIHWYAVVVARMPGLRGRANIEAPLVIRPKPAHQLRAEEQIVPPPLPTFAIPDAPPE